MDRKQEAGKEAYNRAFRRRLDDIAWRMQERKRILPVVEYIVGNSVLDLGCSYGALADMIQDRKYTGVDFSEVAIEYAREHVQSPNAQFVLGSFYDDLPLEVCDTVVLLQVLEHTWGYKELFDFACELANERVIVTVPRNAPGGTHLKHLWSREDLEALGSMEIFKKLDNIRWLAVYDMRKDVPIS